MSVEESRALIQALRDPARYDHPVKDVQVIETHISWVILTGDYAYKIKKPVDLGFLDYTTLEKRRRFCEEEMRLNRRLAPSIYIGVVPITGSYDSPRIGGDGEAVEYALKMAEFPQDDLLDRTLKRGELSFERLDAIARIVADFHGRIEVAGEDTPFGTPEAAWRPVEDNFRHISLLVEDEHDISRLKKLRQWSEHERDSLKGHIASRKKNGFVRECHGDMHLGNMALVDGKVVIFDCIEFNDFFRWTDVMSEVAFLVMDLEDHKRPDMARRALNLYLQVTGDYEGLRALQYYKSYRAMVRAKVACISLARPGLDAGPREEIRRLYREYFALAESYKNPPAPSIMITHGLTGAGKTTITQTLLEENGAIRIRSDVERKRLFGVLAEESSGSPIDGGIYTSEANVKTYARLEELAGVILNAGYPVIVDAAFLKRKERDRFERLARRLGVPFTVLDFTADEDVLRERVVKREREGKDASEATLEVLEIQARNREPLAPDERGHAVTVDTNEPAPLSKILEMAGRQPV